MQDSKLVMNKCPVEQAIMLINKKWVIQIVRDMFFGKSHFNEFKEDKPTLSNKVLSNCLKDMEKNELIERIVDKEYPSNIEYKLTSRGLALNRIIYELARFSLVTNLDNKIYSEEAKSEIEKMFKDALNIEK